MVDLDELISSSSSEGIRHGLIMITDDEKILNYIVDNHGHDMLKALNDNEKNIGITLFFDNDKSCKDLIIITSVTVKGIDESKVAEVDRGLVMFIVKNLYKNSVAKEGLCNIMEISFNEDKKLIQSISSEINKCAMKSIDLNA